MDYNKIGDFLKELRIENKLTQKEVADILVITPQTISKWELGQSLPSVDMLQALSQIYHVTADEIINCKLNPAISHTKSDSKIFLLLSIYFILFSIGISLFFLNYILFDSRAIDFGPDRYPYYNYPEFEKVPIKLGQWFVLVLTIFMPVLLATLLVLDHRKKILLSVTVFSIVGLTGILVSFISDPNFMGAEIGLLLHIIYDLFLVLSTIIVLSYFKTDIYQLLNNNKKEFISAPFMVILAILFPFSFLEHGYYYFRTFEFIIFFFMLVTPCLLIYETVNGSKFFITIYYAIFGVTLIYNSLVDIFNSGLLRSSILQYIYLLFLVLPFYKQDRFNNNLKQLKLVKFFIIVEIASLVVYMYYYLNPGDLFFQNHGSNTIYIDSTPVGKYFHLNIIILFIAMIIRFANFKIATFIIDLIWISWVAYFTYIICDQYVFNPEYIMTDGMFLLIPPLLIIINFLIKPLSLIKFKKPEQPQLNESNSLN